LRELIKYFGIACASHNCQDFILTL